MNFKSPMKAALAVLLAGFLGNVGAQQRFVLVSGTQAPYLRADGSGFLDKLVPLVFKKAKLQGEVQFEVSERGLLNANQGFVDGVAMRIEGLEKTYANLVKVPEPVMQNDFVAVTTNSSFKVNGWDSLRGRQLSHIIGWKVFEEHLPSGTQRTTVRDAEQLFSLLKQQRTEVGLLERNQALAIMSLSQEPFVLHEPPLVSVPMYMYVHRKHADLVPQLSAALRVLKRSGEYQKLLKSAFSH